MRAIEIVFTFIIIIGIIYTVIPTAILAYCFVIAPHMDKGAAVVASKAVVEEETEEIIDLYQPIPAYTATAQQPKTMTQLQTALHVCNPPQPYSRSFDCSEMSAYTEHYLENNGFDTTISASFTEGHAWCTVHNIIEREIVHVECIYPAHISQSLGPVERSYNDINDALAGEYPNEWNWWSEK